MFGGSNTRILLSRRGTSRGCQSILNRGARVPGPQVGHRIGSVPAKGLRHGWGPSSSPSFDDAVRGTLQSDVIPACVAIFVERFLLKSISGSPFRKLDCSLDYVQVPFYSVPPAH